MSGYEANPFADPNADLFSDNSVTQARTNNASDNIGEFNPFANDQFTSRNQLGQPAVLPASSEHPPAYTPSASTSAAIAAATDDLQRRQEALDLKAAELERRERDMQRAQQGQASINNFPPLPSFCPVKPCFYQDFVVDIPSEFQRVVKAGYYLWIAYSCLLFVNIAGSLAYFIVTASNGISNESGTTFGLSILFFVLFTPCSFVCWYRPLYKAFRSDSSFNFFVFFFIFFGQFCTSVVQCLGIDGSGTVGWLSGLTTVNGPAQSQKGVGAFMLIIGCLFTCMAIICMILLIRVHRLYRSTGGSFSKAQQEFSHGIVTNKTVQDTASGVAVAAASGAVGQYGSSANRY